MADTNERYPVAQAERVIAERLSGGSLVLGIEGLWVDENGVRPDLDYIADFSPDGQDDLGEITKMLRSWPRHETFCAEILFIRRP